MRKSVVALGAVFAAMSFASLSPLMAADEPVKHEKPAADFTIVKGTVKSVEGKTLSVEVKGGELKSVVCNDKTEIVKNKVAYTEAIKAGDVITARIKDNVAVRIEVRGDKPAAEKPAADKKHKDGAAK